MDGNPSSIAFIQAAHYRKGRLGAITGATIHSMEAPEKGSTAESVARYFARPDIRPSSAHYNIDSDSIVQSVKDRDTAYHAPGASHAHLGLEHAGYARQTAAEWHDPFSWAMLQLSAGLLGAKAEQYGFPLVYIDRHDLARGNLRGVTTHNEVSQAFHKSNHWDPGSGFPMREYLGMAAKGAHLIAPPAANTVLRLGSKGEAVAFFGDMTNIMAKAGFAINEKGKPSRVQIPIPKSKERRQRCTFNEKLHARCKEVQRFGNVMAKMAGQPTIAVDGEAGKDTARIVAYWAPIAAKKLGLL